MKKIIALLISVGLVCSLAACGSAKTSQTSEAMTTAQETTIAETTTEVTSETTTEENSQAPIADGVYSAKFDTDSSMFRVNEACESKGVLTVENGKMTIHVSLVSKNIVNLYLGTADDAEKADIVIEPTEDEVTYSDGMTEVVYGFDVPVPVLEEEFNLAIIGKKGKWYDHKVSVSEVEPIEE